MLQLARSTDGTILLGNNLGFVPIKSVAPEINSMRKALTTAVTGGLPSPADATVSPRYPSPSEFGMPIPRDELGKLWGIGLNYEAHAGDLDEERPDEPASFMKPKTAAVGPGGPIRLPPKAETARVTAEGEIAVVFGRVARDLSAEEATAVVAGFVPVIDITAEDVLQRNPRFLARSKSYDSFLVFGSTIMIPESGWDLSDITVQTVINDTIISENVIQNMLFSPRELITFHSKIMTLEPGDIISTGTPGAGVIEAGDTVRTEIDNIGVAKADVIRSE